MNKIFLYWIGLIVNIILIFGFIYIITMMFYKDLNFVYIICSFLLILLPASGVFNYIRKIKRSYHN